jgi:hypothetical protein
VTTCNTCKGSGTNEPENGPGSLCKACQGSCKEPEDVVNHPKHYTSHPSGVECIDIVEHLTFCAGNAVKYAWRAGLKTNGDTILSRIEDLKKGRWYLDREIFRLERERQSK